MSTSAITRIFRRHQKIPADIFVQLKADFYVVAISFYQKISLNHEISDTVWLAQYVKSQGNKVCNKKTNKIPGTHGMKYFGISEGTYNSSPDISSIFNSCGHPEMSVKPNRTVSPCQI